MGTTDNSFWIRIQQGLRETEMLMNQNQYNMSMIKARQTLEYMVNYLGEKALIVEGDLADSIDQLFEGRLISQAAKDHYHRIRVIGNKAVHEGNDSPYDAGEALHLLSQEVSAFANTFYKESPKEAPSRQRSANIKSAPIASRNSSSRGSAPQRPAQKVSSGGGRRTPQAGASQRQPQRSSSKGRSRRRSQKNTPDTSGLLRPALIFLGVLVIVLIFVKLVPGKGDKKETTAPETSAEISTEATSEVITEETTEPETEAPKIYTTKSKLNVRSTPSTDGTRLGSLAADTTVDFVKTYDDKWTVIMFEGKEAYVATEFLTESEDQSESSSSETTESLETATKAAQ